MLKILKKKEDRCEQNTEEKTVPPVNGELLDDVSGGLFPGEEISETCNDDVAIPDESEENNGFLCNEDTGEGNNSDLGITPEFQLAAESFAKGREIPAGQMEQGVKLLGDIGEAWCTGALTVELLEIALRGLDYENAVAKAFAEGELQGRNSQIAEKYMKPEDSDGLPHPSGQGNASRSSRRVSSIFDLARDAG